MSFRPHIARIALSALFGLSLLGVGCAGGGDFTRVKAEGTAKIGDKPLPNAGFTFDLQDAPEGSDEFYSGASDEQGKIWMEYRGRGGMPVGTYDVRVDVWMNKAGEVPPNTEEGENMKDGVQFRQYNAATSVTISEEDPTFTVELGIGDFIDTEEEGDQPGEE